MHAIRPIESLSRAEVRELAHAAVERCDQQANPFEPGTANHRHYEHDFYAAVRELEIEDFHT